MILGINKEGKLIGLELTSPRLVTLEHVNNVLEQYGMDPIKESTIKPLLAA